MRKQTVENNLFKQNDEHAGHEKVYSRPAA